jgi:hypothetical protein
MFIHHFPKLNSESGSDTFGSGSGGGGAAGEGAGPAGGGEGSGAGSTDTSEDSAEGLKAALARERQARKAAEAEAGRKEAALREVGNVNPKLLEDARAAAKAAEEQARLAQERADLRLRDMERKHEDQLSKTTAELKAERAARELERVRILTEKAFLAAQGSTEASDVDGKTPFDYLWLQFQNRFKADKNGLYVVDQDGDPEVDPETGKRIEPKAWLNKLRGDRIHGLLFQPEYGSGSGARGFRDGRTVIGKDLQKMPTNQLFSEAFTV